MAITATTESLFEAGRCGADVRSDLRVIFEPRNTSSIEIELQSRVAPYYGNSIRAQAQDVLAELGIDHARIALHDEGALPFVIAARIEAAVRRAGLGQGRRAAAISSAAATFGSRSPAPLAALPSRQRAEIFH